jgi:hypothetical protein
MHLFSIVTLFDHLVLCDDTSVNEMLLIVQPFKKWLSCVGFVKFSLIDIILCFHCSCVINSYLLIFLL